MTVNLFVADLIKNKRQSASENLRTVLSYCHSLYDFRSSSIKK